MLKQRTRFFVVYFDYNKYQRFFCVWPKAFLQLRARTLRSQRVCCGHGRSKRSNHSDGDDDDDSATRRQ